MLPDASVPTSIRRTDDVVHHGSLAELDGVLDAWPAAHTEGVACAIGDPREFGDGIEGAVDRYVAMTRATARLVALTSG